MLNRIRKLRELFLDLDAVVISNTANIFYLTGYLNFSCEERECYLLITKSKQYLLTDGRYIEAVKKSVHHFKNIEITSTLSYQQVLNNLSKKHRIKTVGIEENDVRVEEYKGFKKIFKRIKEVNLGQLRAVKQEDEIKRIVAACNLADKAFEFATKKLNVGISEKEIASEFELSVLKNGGRLSFETIVAFGENSAIPHHLSSEKRLKSGDLVLIDCGAKVDGYCSDMTRTFVFGKPSKKQEFLLGTVKKSQEKAIDYISSVLLSGKSPSGFEVDNVAREYINSQGFKPFSHGLGHGTGLLIHEAPRLSLTSKDALKEGMVFSIEPGIYLLGFGGTRIEDLFTIQAGKLIQLTRSPRET